MDEVECMRLFRWVMLSVLLVSMALHAKAPAAPDQAEQALRAWINAFNDADREALMAFRARYKMRPDAQGDLEFRADTGGLQVLEIRESTPGRAQLLVQPRSNDRTMLVTTTLDPVGHAATFQFEGAETPDRFKPKRMETTALLAEAKQRLDALVASDAVAGTFLVAKAGEVQMAWHGGMADRESVVPVGVDTPFRLASLNKMFTAVAILQLQEKGKLSLDDPVAQHLPDYPAPQNLRGVTLRQLLTHTSGLGDIFGEKADANAGSLKTLQDYWAVFSDAAPVFPPGSKDQYSNYGFILLGTVIEAVSGQSYYDYVDAHIYRVAGMTATGSAPESSHVPGLAKAYTRVDDRWQRETRSLPWRGTSAGGGYSTVGDLLKFGEALRSGKLLSPSSLAAATSPQNHKAWYGYGFMVRGQGKERVYGHEGGALGANAVFYVLPEQAVVLVGLANVDPDAMGNVVNFVANRLPL
ncbi:serine hydrolase [Stenotrophomonas maltophilia]|uniref:Serine hydrolase n=1 Tax=Stenotrophomonas maltophilia TaxID=40324 RepID=A0A246HPV6_STEMA|nr:serine hydrolase [Stenotrophomonas maltophilia]